LSGNGSTNDHNHCDSHHDADGGGDCGQNSHYDDDKEEGGDDQQHQRARVPEEERLVLDALCLVILAGRARWSTNRRWTETVKDLQLAIFEKCAECRRIVPFIVTFMNHA
ncbi:unnamed protein product, partial [Sphacelaria rigidula]